MKGMFWKRFIAIVTVLTLICSVGVTYGNVSAETGSSIEVEVEIGSAILVEANSGKIYMKKMQRNH